MANARLCRLISALGQANYILTQLENWLAPPHMPKYGAVNGSAISRSYHCGYQHHLVNRARANGRESRTVSEEGKAHLITAISLEMGDHNS